MPTHGYLSLQQVSGRSSTQPGQLLSSGDVDVTLAMRNSRSIRESDSNTAPTGCIRLRGPVRGLGGAAADPVRAACLAPNATEVRGY